MKAIFVHCNCLLRDSHIDPAADAAGDWRLVPATLEAVRLLGDESTLVFLLDRDAPATRHGDGPEALGALDSLRRQIEAGGGRIDALVYCPGAAECTGWQGSSDAYWMLATTFDLRLNECYVLCDSASHIKVAYETGARPVLVLSDRSIGGIMGDSADRKDIAVATDLGTAVNYLHIEETITQQLGHPRNEMVARPEPVPDAPEALPTVRVTSSLAQGVRSRISRSQAQLRDLGRWLSFFVLGAVGLSLGIAYVLTHLYRVQPFPDFVYYVTLQFIPRFLRGMLFIVWGLGVILFAWRSLNRSAWLDFWRKPKR